MKKIASIDFLFEEWKWEKVLSEIKRPMAFRKQLRLALKLRNGVDRRVAVRWHSRSFPMPYRFLRRIGFVRILYAIE